MRVVGIVLLLAAASVSLAEMKLKLLPDAAKGGAVCLDGSPPGYYFRPANNSADSNKWQIYFQGGGWCYNEESCLARSKTTLGSSTKWNPTIHQGGIMSSDCEVNPDFCNFNRVLIPYCDGNSFSGHRDDPVNVDGKNIYFRGFRVMNAVFQDLLASGLDHAEEVLLTGCSAGGLAAYLHADYVGELLSNLPSLKKYKVAPISGFFLRHATAEGISVYAQQMQNIFHLSNATAGVNQACIASKPSSSQWQCNFAADTYAHTESDVFVLNSAYDSWQTRCIFTSELPKSFPNGSGAQSCGTASGWATCVGDPQKCSADQRAALSQYQNDFVSDLKETNQFPKAGHGAFIDNSYTHCAAQSDAHWAEYVIGGVTMQQAVSKWWKAASNVPADENSYVCVPFPKQC